MEQIHHLWSDSELKFAECFRISLATLIRLLSTASFEINKFIGVWYWSSDHSLFGAMITLKQLRVICFCIVHRHVTDQLEHTAHEL